MLPDPDVRLRSATAEDALFVVEMARHACVIEDWKLPDANSEETQSLLPGRGDITVVATSGGVAAGAVWTFRPDPPLFVAAPEITIPPLPPLPPPGARRPPFDQPIVPV